MAIGGAVAQMLQSGAQSRQPASGVEEQISFISKDSTTDELQITLGGKTQGVIAAATVTTATPVGWNNCAMMLTNATVLATAGATDEIWIGGVQTNV